MMPLSIPTQVSGVLTPNAIFSTSQRNRRGRHRTPGLVSDLDPRPFAQRRQGRGSKLPLQDFRCIHGRDQVGFFRSPDLPRLDRR
jgi:hypothetical protein